jgi:hypothetical protein
MGMNKYNMEIRQHYLMAEDWHEGGITMKVDLEGIGM